MDHQRPPGFRFQAGGVNLRSSPDSLQPNKYSAAKNCRWLSDQSVRTRSGWSEVFASQASGTHFTDMQAFAAIETDDQPRIIARDTSNYLVSDNGRRINPLYGPDGFGVAMIPFRPGASAQTWMYVAGQGDYQKLNAPTIQAPAITMYKVGIAEPQTQVEAGQNNAAVVDFTGSSAGTAWTVTPTDITLRDLDPVNDMVHGSGTPAEECLYVMVDGFSPHRRSINPKSNSLQAYQVGMLVQINSNATVPIEELWPAIPQTTIAGIQYKNLTATSGPCVIALASAAAGTLGKGSLVQLNFGEVCLVWDVIQGPGGIAIETSTTGTHAANEAVTGINTFVITGPASQGDTIQGLVIQTNAISDTGTPTTPLDIVLSQAFPTGNNSPFVGFNQDDYVHFTIALGDTDNLLGVVIQFDVGASSIGAFVNTFEYSIPLAQLTAGGSFSSITVPISSLSSSGGGDLAACSGVRLIVTTSGVQSMVAIGSLWVGGGANPDVGDDGVPYQYRAVPRSSITGAMGNPSPEMRYGISPRRQSVTLTLPIIPPVPKYAYDGSPSYGGGTDWQVDTWDIYRYGGTVTSYQYIGSTTASSTPGQIWVDNVSDAAAQAGQPLQTDNFEPWPSIDVPWNSTGISATLTGDLLVVNGGTFPASILQWLPGTLIQVGGNQVFTLRSRPGANSSSEYLFQVEENGGAIIASSVYVQEPNVAFQPAPYMFGPDDYGTVFAVGDRLRPGTLYFCKPYMLDSAPDTNTIELCAPSEPLIGGRCINGVAYVSSTNRWWALYPAFIGSKPYQQIAQPVGRPAICPWGITDDGTQLYFWTKDGIVASPGGGYKSLTNDDLYPLFPHEGVDGSNITRNGVTYYAPDYSRVATFRLEHCDGYLYATYQDSSAVYHTLVCDLRTVSWCVDDYQQGNYQMTCHHAIRLQAGGLEGQARYAALMMADTDGMVSKQTDNTGDQGQPINVTVATFQWDGGDQRAWGQWGDAYLDCLPQAQNGITVTPNYPVANGNAVTVATTPARQFATISLAGGSPDKFLGLQFDWTDYSASQTSPTVLYLWQPSIIPQPEIIADRFTDWMSPGAGQCWYFRGVNITADTFAVAKSLIFRNGDNAGVAATLSITHVGQQSNAYAFLPPFVAHLVRIEPQGTTGTWKFWPDVTNWIADPWPELIQAVSAWFNLGTTRAKYLRGVIVPLDTNGQPATLVLFSSDGPSITLPAATTPPAEKTAVSFAFSVPLIGHEFQFQLQQPARIWPEEVTWDFEPWPELIPEATNWFNMGSPGAKYLRGAVIPMDTGGNPITMGFFSSDGQAVTMPISGTTTTTASEKTPVAYAFHVPLVGHEFQLRPTPANSVRIWTDEIQWIFDPWPELIPIASAWMNLGGVGAKYLRGAVIPCDTNGVAVSLTFVSSDGGTSVTVGPFTTPVSEKTEMAWAFTVPLIGHEFQLQPTGPIRVWYEEIRWTFDPWPELIALASPWMNLGNEGAKYMRGAVIPCETGGQAVSLTFVSSDGGTYSVGPFTTPVSEKTEMPWAFTIPLIGHEFQLIPSGPIRVWYSEIRWDFQPWPELITEATGWLPVNGGQAGYLQGFVVPVEDAGNPPQLSIIVDTSPSRTIPLTATAVPSANVKTGVAYSLNPPVACHYAEIVPTAPCRIWLDEIKWIAQPTPETATTWSTQWTSFGDIGLTGYLHVPYIELAYASSTPVNLQIQCSDGQQPQALTFPANGNSETKVLLHLTPNKGTLYKFSATSSSPFQIFEPDSVVWVGQWGRQGNYVPWRGLGGQTGANATI